jgi:hypothetical protein
MRSISTRLPTFGRVSQKIPAAPFPSLPTRVELQEHTSSIEREIASAKADLSSLLHERSSFDAPHRTQALPTPASSVREYNNIILVDSVIDSVMSDNRQRKEASESHPSPIQFKHIAELPRFQGLIRDHGKSLVPLLTSHLFARQIERERELELTLEFVAKHGKWKETSDWISKLSDMTRPDLTEEWPKKFGPAAPTRLLPAFSVVLPAPDEPMFISQTLRSSNCFYDRNSFVEDPSAEFDDFRGRISWSGEEEGEFIAKYIQHPKKFNIIAQSLPLKSTKDVIEFYYVNKDRLSLKAKEGARKLRRSRLISEGRQRSSRS